MTGYLETFMDATIIGALGFGALGFVLGAGLVWLISRARQAELKARLEAGEHMRTEMENQFEVTANRAVQNAHESFLKLAEARLKDAQKDGAHDLDKRHKAIDEMIKPVHENLKTLSGALEQMIQPKQAKMMDCKVMAEAANAPCTPAGDRVLTEKGIEVIPAILANSGGVTVSYFEWVQNKSCVTWDAEQVDQELNRHMVVAARRSLEARKKYNCGLRTAAFCAALDHLGEVYKVRGIFP